MISHLKPITPSQESYYLVFSTLVGDDPAIIGRLLAEHLDYLKPFHAEGKMVLGGAFQSLDGRPNGNGMYALSIESLDEAKRIIENDPFHRQGIRRFEILI